MGCSGVSDSAMSRSRVSSSTLPIHTKRGGAVTALLHYSVAYLCSSISSEGFRANLHVSAQQTRVIAIASAHNRAAKTVMSEAVASEKPRRILGDSEKTGSDGSGPVTTMHNRYY